VDSYVCVAEKRTKRKIQMPIVTALRNPTRIWYSNTKAMHIAIEEMDTEYLKNSINMINRGYDIRGRRIGPEQSEKLGWLVEELAQREASEGWDA